MFLRRALFALGPVAIAACSSTVVLEGGTGGGSASAPPGPPSGAGATGSSGAPAQGASSSTSGGAGTGGGQGSPAGSGGSAQGSTGGGSASSAGTGSGGAGGSAQDAGPPVTWSPGFNLVGAYWNGSAVAVDLIDPFTGNSTQVGLLGKLGGWSPNLVLSPDGTWLYGIGNPSGSSANELVTLDLGTGTSTQVTTAQAQQYVLAGATDDGHVIGVFWNGSYEEVDLVDRTTGAGTSVGQLGDLATWPDEVVYDHTGRVVYAWGSDAAQQTFLYSLNVDTHASSAVPASPGPYVFPLGGVAGSSIILGATWDGSVEMVYGIDTSTAIAAAAGPLSGLHDLKQWGAFVYDAVGDMAYAIGTPAGSNQPTLYAFDPPKLMSTSVPVAHDYVLARP